MVGDKQDNSESKLSKGSEEADNGIAEQNLRASVHSFHLSITVFMLHPLEFTHDSTEGGQNNTKQAQIEAPHLDYEGQTSGWVHTVRGWVGSWGSFLQSLEHWEVLCMQRGK